MWWPNASTRHRPPLTCPYPVLPVPISFPNRCHRLPSCSGHFIKISIRCFASFLHCDPLQLPLSISCRLTRMCAHASVPWVIGLSCAPCFPFFFSFFSNNWPVTIASNFLACLCPWEEDAAFRTSPPRADTHEPLHNTHTYTDTQHTHTHTHTHAGGRALSVDLGFFVLRYVILQFEFSLQIFVFVERIQTYGRSGNFVFEGGHDVRGVGMGYD